MRFKSCFKRFYRGLVNYVGRQFVPVRYCSDYKAVLVCVGITGNRDKFLEELNIFRCNGMEPNYDDSIEREKVPCDQAFLFSGERESVSAWESAVGRGRKKELLLLPTADSRAATLSPPPPPPPS